MKEQTETRFRLKNNYPIIISRFHIGNDILDIEEFEYHDGLDFCDENNITKVSYDEMTEGLGYSLFELEPDHFTIHVAVSIEDFPHIERQHHQLEDYN